MKRPVSKNAANGHAASAAAYHLLRPVGATKFEFLISLRAARARGIEIPPPVLSRTDEDNDVASRISLLRTDRTYKKDLASRREQTHETA